MCKYFQNMFFLQYQTQRSRKKLHIPKQYSGCPLVTEILWLCMHKNQSIADLWWLISQNNCRIIYRNYTFYVGFTQKLNFT